MHLYIRIGLFLVIAVSVRAAIALGDTYEQVIHENGQPTGKMQAGDTMILRFADQTVRLKAGKVVAVDLKGGGAARNETVEPSAPVSASKPPRAAAAPASAAAAGPRLVWATNYRAAVAQAKEQDRHVFLFFTGSDWCGWCMKLNQEILSTPEFARYAQEKLVLVEVDFPRGKSQSAELKKQNATLQRIFEIEGYPTVVVLDKAGRAVGRLGYQEGGPGPFVKALKAL